MNGVQLVRPIQALMDTVTVSQAIADGFVITGPGTLVTLMNTLVMGGESNITQNGYNFTGRMTYCTLLTTACQNCAKVAYRFVGESDDMQANISIIAAGAESNQQEALWIEEGAGFLISAPFLNESGNVSPGDGVRLNGARGITFIGGRITNSGYTTAGPVKHGYAINITNTGSTNSSRIITQCTDLGSSNQLGRVNNASLLSEMLPLDEGPYHEFQEGPVLVGTDVDAAASVGDIVLKNMRALRSVTSAGTTTTPLIALDSGDRVDLGAGNTVRVQAPLLLDTTITSGAAAGDLVLKNLKSVRSVTSTSGTTELIGLDSGDRVDLGSGTTVRVQAPLLLDTTQQTGAAAGDLVLKNAKTVRSQNNANSTTLPIVGLDTSFVIWA